MWVQMRVLLLLVTVYRKQLGLLDFVFYMFVEFLQETMCWCSSLGCESNWSTFGIVRPNDFGILSPSWEFSIKIGTTLSTLKKKKIA